MALTVEATAQRLWSQRLRIFSTLSNPKTPRLWLRLCTMLTASANHPGARVLAKVKSRKVSSGADVHSVSARNDYQAAL